MISLAEFSEKGVFLCDCHGSLSKVLPMDALCQFLQHMQPGLPVVVGDDFCQPQILSRLAREHGLQPMVVGACWQLNSKPHFREEPEGVSLDSYSVRIVDLQQEIASSYNNLELIERVKLLLWSQVRRQAKSSSMPQQSRKLRFVRPQGEISRRDLLRLPLPRYQVMPYIETEKCVGGESCHICQDGCPFNAVVSENSEVLIDKLSCRGCGACIAACPFQAICYPTFSLDQLEGEMEGLLRADGDILQPRIVVLICQSCLRSFGETEVNPHLYAPNMLPMEVPCLSMVPSWLLVRALDLGAQGVALVSNKEKCQFGLEPDEWRERVRFVQELLDHWGIQPERVSLFEGGNLEQELLDFDHRIAKLAPISLRPSCSKEFRAEDLPLPALIRSTGERLGAPMVGTVSAGAVPFGKLTLDGSQCSGCGVCAADCPTGALTVSPGKHSYGLLLWQESCVGCGRCIKVCPEGCLHLEKVLELEKLGCRPETVIEGDFVCCEECGVPIAPRAMVETVKARMAAAGGVTSGLETCPDCRMRTKPGLAVTRFGV